jgi:hypothetical protein
VLLAEPAPAIDELATKEPEMGDRAAEARQAETKEDEEYLPGRVLRSALQLAGFVVHQLVSVLSRSGAHRNNIAPASA